MRAMQLDEVEAGVGGALRRLDEGLDGALDAGLVQRLRHRIAIGEGDRRRPDDLPGIIGRLERAAALEGPLGRGLAAGMAELDAEDGRRGREAARRGQRALGRRLVGVGIEAEAAMRDAAAPLDAGRLDRDHAGARDAERGPVVEMPVGRRSVIGRIHAHRRDGDAVGNRVGSEREGREQRGRHGETFRRKEDWPVAGR